jgi:predicted RNase H-related nuclease YkuK (DUF458 family)
MSETFCSSFGVQLEVDAVVSAIISFMKEDPKRTYKIIIGTDSQGLGDKTADFVNAIVVHRVGRGGRYFWRRLDEKTKFHTLRDRIIHEVMISLDAAHTLLAELKAQETIDLIPQWEFEIHADVGANGPTNALIQEVVGMIRANNFEAKTKPESYAASSVADRHT